MPYRVQQDNTSFSDSIAVTPTLDTNAYATGDRLGTLQTITGATRLDGGRAVLQSVTIIDQAKQSQPIDILFFDSSVSIVSNDNAAIDISDSELLAKAIGCISVSETYVALANNSMVSKPNIGLGMKAASTSNTLYALPVIRGTGTYAASSLKFIYNFLQD